ncbi:MAG: hypothetical protein GX316_09185 [Firmicutes bacterium]|nr:hypothetical protein [Bacillota bacterium]
MERAILPDEHGFYVEETWEPVGSYGLSTGFFAFLRRMGLRFVTVWSILMLFSYQVYLVDTKQILAHPFDVFVKQVDMAIHSLTIVITVELPPADSFAALKSKVSRAGRLFGAKPEDGLLDARQTAAGKSLQWITTDGKGRHLSIVGKTHNTGKTTLLLELTEWGIGKSVVKDRTVWAAATAAHLGKIRTTVTEITGYVSNGQGGPETWLRSWSLDDLDIVHIGNSVKLQGKCPDLAQNRLKPVPFFMEYVPDEQNKGGRLTLMVEN